jgi:nucleolar protein 4
MTIAPTESKLAKAMEASATSAKEGRLIVRNLGFNVTKEQLQERFSDFGEIVDVHMPPSKRTSPVLPSGRPMKIPPHAGYAFIEFDTREQAQAAITAVNEVKISGRRVAVDFAYDTRIYKAALTKEAKSTGSTAQKTPETPVVDKEETAEEPVVSVPTPTKRKAVDTEPTPAAATKKTKSETPVSDENSRKLFLLNLPYDSTKSDIIHGLCEFGKISESDIHLILMVKDKEDKFSGKAFVIFKSQSVAQKILDLEKSSFPESFGDLYKSKDEKSIITPRSTAAPLEGSGCIVNGRRIAILKSLSKEEVQREKEKKEEENKPKSAKVINRNHLDLINTGWINETHAEWNELSAQEQRLRTAANDERKIKLGNPNYVINPKRLTIRNIPKQFENGDLKVAILKAMGLKGSKKAKQAGLIKAAIVKDKILTPKDPEAALEKKPKTWSLDMPESEDDDEDKNIAMKTKKKSRGFAFADFKSTESALTCLKAMNNIMGAFGESIPRRPVVEFAFDDIRKLQIQEMRQAHTTQKTPLGNKPRRTISKDKPKKLSRGQKQRLKRREAKLVDTPAE